MAGKFLTAVIAMALTGATPLPLSVSLVPAAVAQGRDQDCARAAAEAGAMRYGQLRRFVERQMGGKVVSAQCEQLSRERFAYRLTVDLGDGRLVSVLVDAHTGQIIARQRR